MATDLKQQNVDLKCKIPEVEELFCVDGINKHYNYPFKISHIPKEVENRG